MFANEEGAVFGTCYVAMPGFNRLFDVGARIKVDLAPPFYQDARIGTSADKLGAPVAEAALRYAPRTRLRAEICA